MIRRPSLSFQKHFTFIFFHLGDKAISRRYAVAQTEHVPDGVPRHGLGFFKKGKSLETLVLRLVFPQYAERFEQSLEEANAKKGRDLAYFAASRLRLDMGRLRQAIDELELLVDKREWPVPSYGDLLFHTA